MTEQHHTPEHTHTINHTVTAGTEAHVTLVQKPATPAIADLTEGRIVHYVLSSGRNKGEHRPAIVVKDWKSHQHGVAGIINLQVFTDGPNDFSTNEVGYNGMFWATSAHYSETKEPGTWHFIEQA